MKSSKRRALEGTDSTQIIVRFNNDWSSYDSDEGVLLVKSTIMRFRTNEFVQVAGLIALGDIARLDTPSTHFTAADLDFAHEAITTFKEAPKICAAGLYAFGYISMRKTDDIKLDQNSPATIMECISRYSDRKDVQLCGMLAMNSLVLHKSINPLDAIPLACGAMTRFQQEAEVQKKCYLIIGNVCSAYNSMSINQSNDKQNENANAVDNEDEKEIIDDDDKEFDIKKNPGSDEDEKDEKEIIDDDDKEFDIENKPNSNENEKEIIDDIDIKKTNQSAQEKIIEYIGINTLLRGLGMPESVENLFALSEITANNRDLTQQINNAEHILAVLKAMKRNNSNANAQRYGAITLANIFRGETNATPETIVGIVDALVKISKDHAGNLSVVEPLACLMALITDISEDGIKHFCASNGFDNFINTLGKHVSDPSTQSFGAHVIYNVVTTLPKSKLRRVLDYVILAMKELPECKDLYYYGCMTLSTIFSLEKPSVVGPSACISRTESEGGLGAALNGLTTFRTCERTYGAVLHMVALCTHETLGGLEAGGTHEQEIDVVVHNMSETFFDNVDMQFDAIRVLSNVTKDNSKNQGKVCLAGGLQAVIKALKGYPDNEKIQFAGVKLLFFLSENNPRMQEEAEKASAAGANLVQIAIAALVKYAKINFKMALYCFLSLAWIAKGSQSGKREIIQRRGIVSIVEVMRSNLIFEEDDDENDETASSSQKSDLIIKKTKMSLFEKNVFLEYSCFALLHIIEGTSDAYAQVRESHGLNTFLGVLKDFQRSGNEKTQIGGCLGLVSTLAATQDESGSVDCRADLCELGYPEVLITILSNGSTPTATLEAAMRAFNSIMSGRRGLKSTEDCKQHCARYVAKIVALLRKCGTAPAYGRLIQLGFETLATIAEGNEGRQTAVISAGGLGPVYAVLSSNKISAEVCESGLCLLLTLVESSDENRKRIGAEGVKRVMTVMVRHPAANKVSEHGCKVLKLLLANDDDARAAMNNYDIIFHAIEQDGSSEETQKSALHILAAAFERRGNVTQKDLGVITKMMDKFLAHEDIQRLLCSFFAAITTQKKGGVASRNVQAILSSSNAFAQAVTAMGLFQQDELIQESVLEFMVNCAGAAGALMPADCKYVDAVFDALSAHPQADSIHELALTALVFAAENAAPAQTVRPRMAALGGIPFAVGMMNRFPDNKKFQGYGCRLISRIARYGNYTPALATGFVDEILSSVRFFSGNNPGNAAASAPTYLDIEGLTHALSALGAVLAASGAIEHVQDLDLVTGPMTMYPKDEKLQEACCSILACVIVLENCLFSEANVKEAVRLTVMAMHRYMGSEPIQRYGCLVLAGVQGDLIDERTALTLVSKILNKFPDNEDTQAACCKALAHLTEGAGRGPGNDGSNAASFRIDLAGLDGIIKKSIGRHPGCRAVQVYALRTLANLSAEDSDMARKIAANSGIEAVIFILGKHPDDPEVQGAGCHALSNICDRSTYGLRKMFALGGVEAITAAMFKFKSPGIQQWGCNIISKIIMHNLELVGSTGSNAAPSAENNGNDAGNANGGGNNAEEPKKKGPVDIRNRDEMNRINYQVFIEGGGIEALVGALNEFPEDEDVQRHNIFTLGNVALLNPVNLRKICESNGVEPVVAMLRRYGEAKKDMALVGLNALVKFVPKYLDNQTALARAEGIPLVVRLMVAHETCEEAQVASAHIIASCTSKNEDVQRTVAAAGGIEAITAAMARFPHSTQLQRWGCFALGNIASTPENDDGNGNGNGVQTNQEHVRTSNGIAVIMNAMRMRPDLSQMQDNGCYALSKLVQNNAAAQEELGAAGGIALIARAMYEHCLYEPVQRWACAALGAALLNNPENQAKLAACTYNDSPGSSSGNGVVILLTTMRRFPLSERVLANSIMAIISAVSGSSMENLQAISFSGGIELVVDTMKRFGDSADIQRWGCIALRSLSAPLTQSRIGECDGIGAIVAAMKAHPWDTDILQWACLALSDITAGNAANQARMSACGAAPAIVTVLNDHTDDINVQRWGCYALGVCAADNPENSSCVGECGGIAAILNALEKYPENEDILRGCLYSLGVLAFHNDRNKTLISVGVHHIISALIVNQASDEVLRSGCYALVNISEGNVRSQQAIEKFGGTEALIRILAAYSANAEILTLASAALRNVLSSKNGPQAKFCTLDGISTVLPIFMEISVPASSQSAPQSEQGSPQLQTPSPSQSPLIGGGSLIEAEKNLLAILASAAYANPPVQAALVAKDGCVERVVDMLQARCMDSELLRLGCRLLGSAAAKNIKTQQVICATGGIQAIMKAAMCFQGDPRVQIDAAHALRDIVQDSMQCQSVAAELQAPEMVLRAMTRFAQVHEVQRSGFKAIASLASGVNRAMQDSIVGGSNNAFVAITSAMTTHGSSGSMLSAACLAVYALMNGNDANRKKFISMGGIRYVAKAMAAVPNNKELQINGCTALACIAQPFAVPSNNYVNGEESEMALKQLQQEVIDNLVTEKVGEKVVNAMASFLGDVHVLTSGCSVLNSFFVLTSNSFPLENVRAIEVLIAALNIHRADEDFQLCCLAVLRKIIQQGPAAMRRVAGAGGIESIVESMKALPASVDAQVSCCDLILSVVRGCADVPSAIAVWTPANIGIVLSAFRTFAPQMRVFMPLLDQIARSSKGALEVFVAAGGLNVTSELMTAYSNEQDIQECGVSIISHAFSALDTCDYTLGNQEINNIIWAMGKCADDLRVQINCLVVIRSVALAGPRAARVAICNAGAMPLIVGTVMSSKATDEVRCAGCQALKALVHNEPDIQSLYRMNSGLEVAIEVLRSSSSSVETLVSGLRLIAAAVDGNAESQVTLLRDDGPKVILSVMSAHLDSVFVQEHGCRAIAAMIPSEGSNREAVLNEMDALGVSKTVFDIATRYETCPSLQAAVFSILADVATASYPDAQERVGSIDNIKYILSTLDKFGADTDVQVNGYRVLQSITDNAPENRTKVLLSFDFDATAQSLAAYHKDNIDVQRAAFYFVAHVVYDNKRFSSCVSVKTVAPFLCSIPICAEAIAESLEAGRDEHFCMFALACLAEYEHGLDDSLRGSLFSFIEKRAGDAEIMVACLKALKKVNLDGITKNLIEVDVKSMHPDNDEIQKLIKKLM